MGYQGPHDFSEVRPAADGEDAMNILVINCGSSTIKAAVIDAASGARLAQARVERIDEAQPTVQVDGDAPAPCPPGGHAAALAHVLPLLAGRAAGAIAAVGHRVVHGGERFTAPTRVDAEVEAAIEALIPLAPLHNPANLAGLRAARAALPDVPHVAVFDTAFHATLPRRARAYALPQEVVARHGLRRYGFHGTSHAWVAARAAERLGEALTDLRIITCHLGNGCSVAAVEYGRSVETSMGMTPLEGLVMGTRSGDVDPGVLIALLRSGEVDADGLDRLLNRQSGLAGLSGGGHDMRDIEERAAQGDDRAQLAIHVFAHRVRKYVGAYAAVMGGVDALVFTGGIGQNSALIRHSIAQRLEFMGVRLDDEANRGARATAEAPAVLLSVPHSRVKVLAVATDEEHAIARETALLASEQGKVAGEDSIPVAISARHIHLSVEAVAALFGEGHELTPKAWLSQPGEFAAAERVNLIGPKRRLENVRVVGPTRGRTQVEISRSDEFHLGLDAPVRGSGDIDNTPGITLEGPAGTFHITEGVICSQRHIHMTPGDAERFGVVHKDIVEVAIDSEGRDLVFGDVLVRVKETYALEMHVDTDEGNAAEMVPGGGGVLLTTGRVAHLRRRATRPEER
jgi:acetate kinase